MDKDKGLDFGAGAAAGAEAAGAVIINSDFDAVESVMYATKLNLSAPGDFDSGAHTKALSVNTQVEESAGNPKLVLTSKDASLTITQGIAPGSEALEVSTNVPGHHVDYSLTGESGITFSAVPDEE